MTPGRAPRRSKGNVARQTTSPRRLRFDTSSTRAHPQANHSPLPHETADTTGADRERPKPAESRRATVARPRGLLARVAKAIVGSRTGRSGDSSSRWCAPANGVRLGECGVEVFAEQAGELVWLVLLHEVTGCGQQRQPGAGDPLGKFGAVRSG